LTILSLFFSVATADSGGTVCTAALIRNRSKIEPNRAMRYAVRCAPWNRAHRTDGNQHEKMNRSVAGLTKLPSELETIGFRFESSAKNLSIERVLEAVAYESRIIVFDIHVELAGVADEKVQNLAVISELLPWQDDLIRTFFIELAKPSGSFIGTHLFHLDQNRRVFTICSTKSRTKSAGIHYASARTF
jgi:hypothetical protein